MDNRSPLLQSVARLLIGALLLNPLLSTAAELSLDAAASNASLSQAANGVPLVNIATPNASGLSHNRFSQYNVGAQGLILNNGTHATQSTQLGGIILGNSNLHGEAASLILNEVNGSNISQLNGYTEVAGQAAHVVVANPHGISCNGCGFINTPRVTLTTGSPVIEQGQLQRFEVSGGAISIDGAGLNAGNVGQFDLITRSAQINVQLQAQQLNVIAGRNQVDADTLQTTAKPDDGSATPLLAVDSSALGGMYAGSIRLVGTEAGVGVKLAGDLVSSAGDMQLDVNGQLSLARISSSGDLRVHAESVALHDDVDVVGMAELQAGDSIDLQQDRTVAAGGDLQLRASEVNNAGTLQSGSLPGGGTSPESQLSIDSNRLNNSGLLAGSGKVRIKADYLKNQQGTVLAEGDLSLEVTELNNRDGQLIAQQKLDLHGHSLDNRNGTLASNQAVQVSLSGTLDNSADGLLFSKAGGLQVSADQLNNAGGTLQADQGTLQVIANNLVNQAGSVQARAGAVDVLALVVDNHQGGLIARGGALTIHGQRLDNSSGYVQGDTLELNSNAELNNQQGQLLAALGETRISSERLLNQDGQMLAAGDFFLSGGSLENQGGAVGARRIALHLSGDLDNSTGLIESATELEIQAASLRNENGRLRALGSDGESSLLLSQQLDNSEGVIEIGNARFSLRGSSLNNQGGSLLHLGNQGFELQLADLEGFGDGEVISNSDLTLTGDSWVNRGLLQAANLTLNIQQLSQEAGGQLIGVNSFSAAGSDLYNDGLLASDGDFSLNLSGNYDGFGNLLSLGDLQLHAASLSINEGAAIRSGAGAQLTLNGTLSNNGGQLTAFDALQIQSAEVNNNGVIGSAGSLLVDASRLHNESLLFSGTDMALLSDHLSNLNGDIYSLGRLLIAKNANGDALDLLENTSASIESADDMWLNAAVLENRKEYFQLGQEQTYGHIQMVCLDCSGDHFNVDFIATERFSQMIEQDSMAARIHSGGDLTITAGTVSNRYSSLSASSDLSIRAASLENLGASGGVLEHQLRVNTGRTNDGDVVRLLSIYVNPYNAAALPKTLPTIISGMPNQVSDIETFTPDGSLLAPALIQAGGNVSIQTSQSLSNGTIQAFTAPLAGTGQQLDTGVNANQQTLQVRFNPQLPPDLTQRAVNPLELPGFSLPQRGLFQLNLDPGHPYLVETNPAFASLKNFLNSDYLLSRLGYSSDDMQRRLGDGLYEQRLIQQAIIARTGQRFLAGLESDEAIFQYLMDNAVASQEFLQLTVGVALSAEQMAALTHDIVWLQEQEVRGQKVLVPVLYLAQANDRLAPSGALIQGQNLALISGSTLSNSGTLRASQNFSVSANRIDNSGLMQANQRLQLLATDSIHNTQGGIINGQDVSAIALSGDIFNQRSIATQQRSGQGYSQTASVVDSAARIEAGNQLSLSAGNDIQNIGSSITAGGDAQLDAGSNLLILSAEEQQGMMRQDKRQFFSRDSTNQHASDVQVGGDLQAFAGNSLAVAGSSIKAEGDIALLANGGVTVASAANQSSKEYRYKGNGKKVTIENSHVSQQGALIEAGGDLDIAAGHDLTLVASQLDVGASAYLYAGNQLNLLAAQNSDYSLYDYSKKGSWGSKKTQKDEVTTVSNVGSSISSVGDLSLVSEGSQSYQGARLESDDNLTLDSSGAINFAGVKDFKQESHESSSSDLAWNSSKGKGKTDETLRQSQLIAQGEIAIRAAEGLNIEIRQINRQTVSQTIDAMVKADPQLTWLKDAEARGDVDWRRVKEVHDSFKYSNSGLGQGAAIALAIAITAITSGAASAAVGSMAGATAGSGTAMAAGVAGGAAAGFGNAAATAVLTSMAATAAVSTVNNRGNLGNVVDDTFSSDSINGYATGAAVAGFTAYTNDWGRELADDGNYRTVNIPVRAQAYVANTALKGLVSGDDTSKSWLTIAGTGAMMELYQYSVGRGPDVRPGVDRPDGAKFDENLEFVPRVNVDGVLREGKNFGFNKVCFSDFSFCQGMPVSDFLNQVPGMNSLATLHDTWMKSIGQDMTVFENFGTMLPAAFINYGAAYDKYRVISQSIHEKYYE